jgi:rubrerythrin
MATIKNTTLLEAVASAIEYEKDCFQFYMKNYESISESNSIKEFFKQLAEDGDEHIKLIQELYNELSGGVEFPNLKQLSAIHKFHSTSIFKIMKKVERNINKSSNNNLETVELAMKSTEDARDFYNKMKEKFQNHEIKLFFKKLADFSEDNRLMMEAMFNYLTQTDKVDYYWEDEDLMKQTGIA